jgi:hypothetical protein
VRAAVKEMKQGKAGKLKGRPVQALLNELYHPDETEELSGRRLGVNCVRDRSGTPQRGTSEEYSGKPDSCRFGQGARPTSTSSV